MRWHGAKRAISLCNSEGVDYSLHGNNLLKSVAWQTGMQAAYFKGGNVEYPR